MSGPRKYRTDGKGTTLEGKRPGWFSMRHQTSDEHVAAREAYLAAHGPTARRRRAAERERSP